MLLCSVFFLLPTPEDCIKATTRDRITKDLILQTKYEGRRRTCSSIQGPSSCYRGTHGGFLVAVWRDTGCFLWQPERGWSFNIMLNRKAFLSIPNCLEVGVLKLPIIVTGRKPVCWKCGETGHLSFSCPEKKASGSPAPVDQNTPLTAF